MITRYIYNKLTYQLMNIQSYEKQTYSMINDVKNNNDEQYKQFINTTGIEFITWQIIEYLDEMNFINNDKRIEEIVHENHKYTLDEECRCLNGLLSKCKLGLAGSWSGLIGDHKLNTMNQAILLHNEINHINHILYIDYITYYILDNNGGLQLSNMNINLINNEDETSLSLLNINIQANELMNLGNILPYNKKQPQQQQSTMATTTTTGETWLYMDLNYLDISLLPYELFSGGISNIMSLLFSSTSQFKPFIQFIKLPIDQRIQTTLSSGWLIQLDHIVSLTIRISNALETSIWRLTGRNNVRTEIGFVNDIKIHLVELDQDEMIDIPISHLYIHKGNAIQGYIDFITDINIKNLPDSICLAMNQGGNTFIVQWYTTNMTMDSTKHSSTTMQNNDHSYHYVSNYTLQPVSYNLGYDNSLKCKKMNAKTIW
uniref:MTP_lip_bd domain-containing protein n=1 Tax=Schistosoma mansoni TaxID=6183 RepID=A0A5K4FBB6_SCHMA